MPILTLRELEDKIGPRSTAGETALRNTLSRGTAEGVELRLLLNEWLNKSGIPFAETRKAVDNSRILAYCNRNYLAKWRTRVNPNWALLGGFDDDDEPAAAPEGPPAPATAGGVDLQSALDAVAKMLDSKLAGLKMSPSMKDEVFAEARKAGEAAAREAARATIAELAPPREIVIKRPEAAISVAMGLQHERFPLLLRALQAKTADGYSLNVWLTGPAGAGKTTAAANAAKALSLTFEAEGALDGDFKLMGYLTPDGKYVETAFYRRFTQGGLILLDEIDNYSPSALLALNAALANNWCQFPCGMKERHKDCIIIAGANTWGLGATNDYVGRAKLDAATLDRFQPKIAWPIDEKLERAVAQQQGGAEGLAWHDLVLDARAAARRQGLKILISPRATFGGISLLQQGFSQSEVVDMTFGAGLTPEQLAALDIKPRSMSADDEIADLIRRGEKIQAIKLYRETYNVDLPTAKTVIETMWDEVRVAA